MLRNAFELLATEATLRAHQKQTLDAGNSFFIDDTTVTPVTGVFVLTRVDGIVRILTVVAAVNGASEVLGGSFTFQFSEDGVSVTIARTFPIGDLAVPRAFNLINAGAYYRISFTPSVPLVPGQAIAISTTLRRQDDGDFATLASDEQEEASAAFGSAFAYLKVFSEITGKSVNLRPNERGNLITADFLTEVAKGNVAGHRLISQLGRNDDVDAAAFETLWTGGGAYVYPVVAGVISTVSASLLDDGAPAGTGAHTVTFEGLNAALAEISETIVLNGIVPVLTVLAFLRVNRAFVATAGALGSNQGLITATVGVIVIASIPVGTATVPAPNRSLAAIRTIPAGHVAYLLAATFAASNTAVGFLRICEPGGATQTRDRYQAGASTAGAVFKYDAPVFIPAGSDVQIDAQVTNNNTVVTARFDMLLVEDV
jgi:hypothetical protein